MPKAFIFDWSGTLSDNFHCFVKVCELIFKDAGLKTLSAAEIRLQFDTPYMKFWGKYFPGQTQMEHHLIYEKYIHQVGDPELYSGVREIIISLKAIGYDIFVLSSDNGSKLMPEVEVSGLKECFTKVVGDVHDKAEILDQLVREFTLTKTDTFYVGDTAGDIEAGKYAGLKTIGISWGFQDEAKLEASHPDFLISDIIQIKDILGFKS
jgi:phosphoglycolate phosphatase-like HAD superfamily hydrolase